MKSSSKRAHVVLPPDLVSEIDRIAGTRGRSAFLAELARREIKRRKLLDIFKQEKPIWRDEDHPELQAGAADWVRRMRAESEVRFQAIQDLRDRE